MVTRVWGVPHVSISGCLETVVTQYPGDTHCTHTGHGICGDCNGRAAPSGDASFKILIVNEVGFHGKENLPHRMEISLDQCHLEAASEADSAKDPLSLRLLREQHNWFDLQELRLPPTTGRVTGRTVASGPSP